MIDISGLDKAEVLTALFNGSRQQDMGFMDASGVHDIDAVDAQGIIDDAPELYFDYLRGRVMKVDLTTDELDPRRYDRDNGDGAAATALAHLVT